MLSNTPNIVLSAVGENILERNFRSLGSSSGSALGPDFLIGKLLSINPWLMQATECVGHPQIHLQKWDRDIM